MTEPRAPIDREYNAGEAERLYENVTRSGFDRSIYGPIVTRLRRYDRVTMESGSSYLQCVHTMSVIHQVSHASRTSPC